MRKQAGDSLAQVAAELEVRPSTISMWLSGANTPTKSMCKLAYLLSKQA